MQPSDPTALVLSVDIGGTKTAAALVDDEGVVRRSDRVPTGPDPWAALTGLLDGLLAPAGDAPDQVRAIGVGCGGPMQWPSGEVSPLNIPAWRGFPLVEELARRYALPVRIHNDAVCLALGEHWRGAGVGADAMLGMVVSTGVGGGIVLGGRAVDGATGNAGHIGHVVVEPDGPDCACGGRGCLEAVASGPSVVARAVARGCAVVDGRQLVVAADAGDAVAMEELARAGRALGLGIASAAALLDVPLVVLGGGLSQAGDHLWVPLQQEVAARARLGFLADLRVVPAGLGQEAGLVGAAGLWRCDP